MSAETLSPVSFLLLILALWCGIYVTVSLLSGWHTLSKKFPCPREFQTNKSFRLTSVSLGPRFLPVTYGNSVFVSIGEVGIRISILLLFRILHPPILIPWDEVESVKRERYMLVNSTLISIKNDNRRVRFYWRAGKAIFEESKGRNIQVEV
jgi:hypothetical protein